MCQQQGLPAHTCNPRDRADRGPTGRVNNRGYLLTLATSSRGYQSNAGDCVNNRGYLLTLATSMGMCASVSTTGVTCSHLQQDGGLREARLYGVNNRGYLLALATHSDVFGCYHLVCFPHRANLARVSKFSLSFGSVWAKPQLCTVTSARTPTFQAMGSSPVMIELLKRFRSALNAFPGTHSPFARK